MTEVKYSVIKCSICRDKKGSERSCFTINSCVFSRKLDGVGTNYHDDKFFETAQ